MVTLLRMAVEYGAVTMADAGRRVATTLATLLLALALFMASLGFLTFAAYRALAANLGDIRAALILAAVYLIAALLLLVALQWKRR